MPNMKSKNAMFRENIYVEIESLQEIAYVNFSVFNKNLM